MKILLLLPVFFSVSLFARGDSDQSEIRKDILDIVAKIEQKNMLMSEAVGVSGTRPEQYDNFLRLKSSATTDELIKLTDHPNGVVRAYSFLASASGKDVDPYPILLRHITDDTPIHTMFGCIVMKQKVGDIFIQIVSPKCTHLRANKLTSRKLEQLDRILLFTPNNLAATSEALARIPINEKYYPRIRELAVEGKHREAMVALAKYQKEADIPVILDHGKNVGQEETMAYVYRAVAGFPHPRFFPFLKRQLKAELNADYWKSDWLSLYEAIAAYKNDEAINLLQLPFSRTGNPNMKKYHFGLLFDALRNHKTGIYDDMIWELWSRKHLIDTGILKYFLRKYPEKSYRQIKKDLRHVDRIYDFGFRSRGGDDSPGKLIDAMLQVVLEQDGDFAIGIIRHNIRETHVHLFRVFARKAFDLRDKSFIDPLFERISTESNAHIYLAAVRALLAYEDMEINDRILSARDSVPHLREGWGGDALDKLLNEHLHSMPRDGQKRSR